VDQPSLLKIGRSSDRAPYSRKYSNATDRERLRHASSRGRAARVTTNDRDAESSRRGGQGFKSPQLHHDLV
jgi:hypothetical protein